jgi:hypothetical protein
MVESTKLNGHHVESNLTGKVITGPELASLLEILVAAANEGSLAEVWYGHVTIT